MRRSFPFAVLAIGVTPGAALAEGKMPQMDFANPLTGAQVVWMAVIMIVLYFLLSRWALPQLGSVIENRRSRISGDLETARRAREESEHMIVELNLAIRNAREASQAAIAEAVNTAKGHAREQAAALNAKLDEQVGKAEAEIEAARGQAVAALPPAAREVTATLLERLTGETADPIRVDQALAALSA